MIALGSGAGLGQVPPGEAQRRLEAGRAALADRQKAERTLSADIGELQAERERLNQSLFETARLIQASEAQLSTIESRLGELDEQEKVLRGSLAQRHASIAQLLAAMQRMGRNPPPVMITRREDALKMVRSAMVLSTAFPEMKSQAVALAEKLEELSRIVGEARAESERLKAETARLSGARTRLAELMETKRQSLAERQVELERVRRETAEIAKSVNDLSELISRLDRATPRPQATAAAPAQPAATASPPPAEPAPAAAAPAPATTAPSAPDRMASAEPNVPRPSAPQPGAAAPASPQAVVPPPSTGGPPPPASPGPALPTAIELAPRAQDPRRDFGRMEPAQPFVEARGRLPMPAQGRRVLGFGDRTQYGSQSKGIVLETRYGGQVTSPADGWVIFAGEFRTFGQLLIIDVGGGYHVLLAGLSQIDVQPRQFVLAGEPVGVMQNPPRSAATRAADSAPVLYIEFRKDNRPIDPDPWWLSEGQRKVQ